MNGYTTELALERFEKRLERIEAYIKGTTQPSRWMTQEEAMEEIGCKGTKLKELRMSGKIKYRYAGEGRGIRILRKSVDEYNNTNL